MITKHLSNIFKEGELDENSTCANFAQVADNGKTYKYKFYSLAAIMLWGIALIQNVHISGLLKEMSLIKGESPQLR